MPPVAPGVEQPSLVGQVDRMFSSAGRRFSSVGEIPQYVEPPLVPAMTDLFKKGVLTINSSANKEDKTANFSIDWESLSNANKGAVLKILGLEKIPKESWSGQSGSVAIGDHLGDINFFMPIGPETPTADIELWGSNITKQFVLQKATWEKRYTLGQMKEYDKSFTELNPTQICEKTGYYYAPDGLFYRDEDAYKRYYAIVSGE